ncbi:MAG: hypothetical protein M5U01_02020 [Ardenticatenaceae bacterium]|nr:hypothetical protein [Ardenticatenaceae bacterium]
MNLWHNLPRRPEVPRRVTMIVGIPKGTRNKDEDDIPAEAPGWDDAAAARPIIAGIIQTYPRCCGAPHG